MFGDTGKSETSVDRVADTDALSNGKVTLTGIYEIDGCQDVPSGVRVERGGAPRGLSLAVRDSDSLSCRSNTVRKPDGSYVPAWEFNSKQQGTLTLSWTASLDYNDIGDYSYCTV